MHNLGINLRDVNRDIDKLKDLERNIHNLSAKNQKLISEIVLLRLFSMLEDTIVIMACKIVCKATYLDGSTPIVLVNCSSSQNALQNMRNYNRTKEHKLRWTKVTDIKENLKFVLDPNEHFIKVIDYHGADIDEIRRVRNRIAHNSPQSRRDYQVVVRRYYGSTLNHLTPGNLLMSTRFSPNLIQQYLIKTKILVKEMIKG